MMATLMIATPCPADNGSLPDFGDGDFDTVYNTVDKCVGEDVRVDPDSDRVPLQVDFG